MKILSRLLFFFLQNVDNAFAIVINIMLMTPAVVILGLVLSWTRTDPWFLNNYHIALKCGDLTPLIQYPFLYLRAMGEIILGISALIWLGLLFIVFESLKHLVTEARWKLCGTRLFFSTSAMTHINADSFGDLYELSSKKHRLVIVKVKNSTPEADGSVQKFYLRVPPHVETAKEAVAWTFQSTADNYAPAFES